MNWFTMEISGIVYS